MATHICRDCREPVVFHGSEPTDIPYWDHAEDKDYDHEANEITVRMPPVRGARLNQNYALVRLTYLQAQALWCAAAQGGIGLDGKYLRANREGLAKLLETQERWPQ